MRRQVVISSIAIMATLLFRLQLVLCTSTEEESLATVNVSPYLLFTTAVRIYRMNLDGSGVEVLVYEQNPGILGLEYHYRLNLLFWTNTLDPSIKQANLDGSNVRKIVTSGPGDLELRYPVDLALDWINDKLYWTDRDVKKIGVYNLVTAERRIILSMGSDSLPFGLAIYPFPHYGWLYWVDKGKETLEVAAVTGEGRQVLESGRRLNCAWPLTLDYTKHTIYWINHCDLRMLSINMDGSQNTRSEHARNIRFSYGISILNDTAFWTQGVSACSVDLLQRKPVTHIIQTLNSEGGTRGIEAVHPMQQPTAEEFRMIVDTGTAECDPPCSNGDCLDPGFCYCDRGWTGLDCLADINECEISNGGCDHDCANSIGNFECTCREGYTLKNDSRSCEDINECGVGNGGCQQRCINILGSFKAQCVCFEGYALNENMICEDINECNTSNGGCEYNCTNFEGGYECTCPGELILDVDGRSCVCFDGFGLSDNMTCEDIDECGILNGGCDHNCTNYEGSYECSCLADFVLGIDGRSCECLDGYATTDNITCADINECHNSNGGCEQNCSNFDGSYVCSCLTNYVLDDDGRSCEDINECLIANGGCPQRCIDLPGTYECGCFDGYTLNKDIICEDINECAILNGECKHSCTNIKGSYQCSCPEGFILGNDNQSCEEMTAPSSSFTTSSLTRTDVDTGATMSSFVGKPQPSSVSSTVRTTPSNLPPSSNGYPVMSSANSQSEEFSAVAVTKISTYFNVSETLIITSSPTKLTSYTILSMAKGRTTQTVNIIPSSSTPKMRKSQSALSLPNFSLQTQSQPLQTNSVPALPFSVPAGGMDHSTSTTPTGPSMSIYSSPPSNAAKPESNSSTLLMVIATSVLIGVLLVAVMACMVAVYCRRAHKSGSWSPPRAAADSSTDSVKFTGSVTATTAVDFNEAP